MSKHCEVAKYTADHHV